MLYDIQQIEQGIKGIMQMMPEKSIPTLADVFKKSVAKLNEPMQLAILGKISSSKSTLVNAILGKKEIMATGQKEVTYNVGWLKYGDPSSDIIIHHKDGTPVEKKNRDEFEKWTTDSSSSEIDNISYVEIFDDAEILKDINIIDTPGLDALRGKDSQNTLDFIRKVHPDAVIMLFTHSVSENVLDIVRLYNAESSFTPLNAVGVLAKIDVLWQEDFERKRTALEIGQRMTQNLKVKNTMLSKSLFDIYPISALLFLASNSLDECVLEDLKSIMSHDDNVIKNLLKSVARFVGVNPDVSISVEGRKRIVDSIGLYGAYVLGKYLKQKPDCTLQEAKEILAKESGAADFQKVLYGHFGMRAKLIKLESVYQNITQTIKSCKTQTKDASTLHILSNVQQHLTNLFNSLVYEHQEYEMLNRIYNNVLLLDDDVKEEFLNLCGEKGASAPERLSMLVGSQPTELLTKADERLKYWRKNIALEPDPEEREWMNVMLKSYSRLRSNIQTLNYQYNQAKAFLFNQ